MLKQTVGFFFVTVMLLGLSNSHSYGAVFDINKPVVDETALLKDIFPTSCHFSGKFTQLKDIAGLPVPLQSTGDFFFSCGLGLIWNANTPFAETLLFANAATHFKIDESGNVAPLSGTVRYGMSRIFLRLLKGDSDYFAEEFAVSLTNEGMTELKPESAFMKKGIDRIHILKNESTEQGVSLNISIYDTTGQMTQVEIGDINDYALESKQAAFEQCELVYTSPKEWCRMLRSPWRYQE